MLVLPDACTDLMWQCGRGAFVAGPDTGPVPSALPPGAVLLGARFRPGVGGAALGARLSELRDQRVDLADLGRGYASHAGKLSPALDPEDAASRLIGIAAALALGDRHAGPDPAVVEAARLLRNPRARTGDIAARTGLSERQLRRRCEAAVGYGPKTLQRVLRFRRFVSRIDALAGSPGQADLAGIAAEAGYADQAHLTRESARLAGLSPAALASARTPADAALGSHHEHPSGRVPERMGRHDAR